MVLEMQACLNSVELVGGFDHEWHEFTLIFYGWGCFEFH
ncbi:hypothetical protein Aeqsu_1260 [Aequorivita sublithincola DSM 14238]|uniref:Uncharacterized protein n=1 Tax=Aequorivita sublithincola (strain DSM 14238 / LMG 21431 / ACAM 643 / 9-3) TaxID=746697 RepID=I3YUT7_AEQSU|nr:hypothetical protein Aeqsu_1260 [Aequorivita sublithincola DSM 14238]